ncbi:MAG: glycosyltransferase family 39 protein [Labilithrix sp.]|nr:glycosyltransferase family 39 protein [Labilithrix sp.]MCW5810320.1 glycosyltransferase family 39 protein [Labilithrix sp.]
MRERLFALLFRYRWPLLAAAFAHGLVVHLLFVGFASWDGFAYRVPPIVELVQHGSFGFEKYNQWAFNGYLPFIELLHTPFIAVFKQAGTILAFPIVAFPLCVYAIFLLGRELTGDARGGAFSALAYAAIPAHNQQPYSGHIDFVVIPLIAFLTYAIIRAAKEPTRKSFLRIVVAMVILSLSRTTAVYLVGFFYPVLALPLFFTRDGFRPRLVKKKELVLATLAIACGSLPSLGIQVWKLFHYGSPIYPYQFQFFGVKVGSGVSTKDLFFYAGLADETPAAYWASFRSGWLWPSLWPPGLFSDSRHFGGGFVLHVALLLVPTFWRKATALEKWLVVGGVLVSFLARDYWLPRWAYTFTVAITIVIGRALAHLSREKGRRLLFAVATGVLALHLARPEFDMYMTRHSIGPRMNVAGSPWFLDGPDQQDTFPDVHARFVIVYFVWNGFILPLYGRRMTNEVLFSVPEDGLGPDCANLRAIAKREPDVLFIDDSQLTKHCARECGMEVPPGNCRAWRMLEPDSKP